MKKENGENFVNVGGIGFPVSLTDVVFGSNEEGTERRVYFELTPLGVAPEEYPPFYIPVGDEEVVGKRVRSLLQAIGFSQMSFGVEDLREQCIGKVAYAYKLDFKYGKEGLTTGYRFFPLSVFVEDGAEEEEIYFGGE